MEKYFIGIDSGTSGIKAVLFDLKGNEIGQKSFPLKGIFPREDMYEEDMLEIWDKAVKCVKAVTGVSGQRDCGNRYHCTGRRAVDG